jgi:hypothetical protein
MKNRLDKSRAFWNRTSSNLDSDEVLAQLLERGEIEALRELYALASTNPTLRKRLKHVLQTVPLPLAHFWLAALVSLGEPVDWDAPLPDYFASGV